MFSGIHCRPMTHRASIAVDGVSICISADRMPSESSDSSAAVASYTTIRVGRRRRLPHPGELNPELVGELIQRIDVDPAQRVQFLDRRRVRTQDANPARFDFLPKDSMIEARSSSLDPITDRRFRCEARRRCDV